MRRSIKNRNTKQASSTFWSMKANPKGASVGNFINNVKSTPGAFVTMAKAIKVGTAGKLIYNDMNPTGKKIVNAISNLLKF